VLGTALIMGFDLKVIERVREGMGGVENCCELGVMDLVIAWLHGWDGNEYYEWHTRDMTHSVNSHVEGAL